LNLNSFKAGKPIFQAIKKALPKEKIPKNNNLQEVDK
jgi:hypothetical protein